MNTSTPDTRRLRAFHTPVRGAVFATVATTDAQLRRGPLRLRREPDNPADPYAVAVWLDAGGTPCRLGYLDRGVAARLARHDDAALAALAVTFAGRWEEPAGRWRRPVVRVSEPDDVRPPAPSGLRTLPPFACRGPVGRSVALG